MKAIILAGGLGTRLSEETINRPKPMVEIGGKPIIWHIMKIYSSYGINDFVICLGYKGYMIKEYFANYFLHMSDVSFDLQKQKIEIHQNFCEPWKITLVDTGDVSMTGGRLKRVRPYLADDEMFCFTYGDGLADIDIPQLISFHEMHGKLATLTTVSPIGRYGVLSLNGDRVNTFVEKPRGDGNQINGGFFVLSSKVIDKYIEGDSTVWEQQPLTQLAADGELLAYRHNGFWQAMDTLRDKQLLEELWANKKAPWKIWD